MKTLTFTILEFDPYELITFGAISSCIILLNLRLISPDNLTLFDFTSFWSTLRDTFTFPLYMAVGDTTRVGLLFLKHRSMMMMQNKYLSNFVWKRALYVHFSRHIFYHLHKLIVHWEETISCKYESYWTFFYIKTCHVICLYVTNTICFRFLKPMFWISHFGYSKSFLNLLYIMTLCLKRHPFNNLHQMRILWQGIFFVVLIQQNKVQILYLVKYTEGLVNVQYRCSLGTIMLDLPNSGGGGEEERKQSQFLFFSVAYILVARHTINCLQLKVRDQITFLTPQLTSKFLRFWYQ